MENFLFQENDYFCFESFTKDIRGFEDTNFLSEIDNINGINLYPSFNEFEEDLVVQKSFKSSPISTIPDKIIVNQTLEL